MDAVSIASQVCNYRHPKLATVKVGGDREKPLLVREGVTSKQVMAELVAMTMKPGSSPDMAIVPQPKCEPTNVGLIRTQWTIYSWPPE